ncbi:MAG: polysaccharide deacetylase family protein [Caldilineaceae bacterium]
MKRLIQQGVKQSLWLAGLMQPAPSEGCAFLTYHSARGHLPIELDLPPLLLARQLAYLAQTQRVIPFEQACSRLQESRRKGALKRKSMPATDGSTFVLTFDDGFRDFYTQVFPLLGRYHLPAILYVNTGFIEDRVAYPMLSYPHLPAEPVTWEMLGTMAESGLVTLGAHTHTHPVLTHLPLAQVEEELARPIELFQKRLGLVPRHFAYPRALWNDTIELLVMEYYASAVVAGGEWASAANFHPYRIPRLPIRRSDGWRYFQAKVDRRMANEEAFYMWVQQSLRRRRAA